MRLRNGYRLVLALAALGAAGGAQPQTVKTPPYWASLAKAEAVMRVGPGKSFPATWVYLRRDLPVRVIKTYPDWRQIQDPDGTVGWVHVRLLKDDKTAIVKNATTELREKPTPDSHMLYWLAIGVVGKVSGCANSWCAFEAQGHSGYVHASHLWGATE